MSADLVVVGGGVAGLAAAAYAGRAGRSVVVCEKATVGGRAVTHELGEFRFNIGPHALYRRSHGVEVLRELGVAFSGAAPNASGGFAIDGGAKHALPGGFLSLLTTGLFGLSAKLETARLLASFGRIDPAPLQDVPLDAWLESDVRQPDVRRFLRALVRLSTYANAPSQHSAGAAIAQLQKALEGNVLYLDGGWQTLVDGLRSAAEKAGARLLAPAKTVAVERDDAGRRVRLTDGSEIRAATVLLACPPAVAAALLGGAEHETLRAWAERAVPVRAACLDVGLSRLPQPKSRFALGVDRAVYLSVHSAYAKLGPVGQAVIHVAKYLGPDEGGDAKGDERELEQLLDLVQPGWRELVVERRFLPNMLVSNALVTATDGGMKGRPGPAVPGSADLFVAGDWVGRRGMLVDASLASAREAAGMIDRVRRPARVAA
jgi:phytoene dehydrogenase-like protein